MIEPNGSATVTHAEMIETTTAEDVLLKLSIKGVPLIVDSHFNLAPHPGYEYTENVDYSRHTITITWSKKL